MTQPKSMSPQQIIAIATEALWARGFRIGNSVAGDQPGDDGFVHITDPAGNEYTIMIEG